MKKCIIHCFFSCSLLLCGLLIVSADEKKEDAEQLRLLKTSMMKRSLASKMQFRKFNFTGQYSFSAKCNFKGKYDSKKLSGILVVNKLSNDTGYSLQLFEKNLNDGKLKSLKYTLKISKIKIALKDPYFRSKIKNKLLYYLISNLFFDASVPSSISNSDANLLINIDSGLYGMTFCSVEKEGESLFVKDIGENPDEDDSSSEDKRMVYKKVNKRYELQSMDVDMKYGEYGYCGLSKIHLSIRRLKSAIIETNLEQKRKGK
jgi:hypothetical protein